MMSELSFDNSWTLFLDRDGVINRRIPGQYVTCLKEFDYLAGSLQAIVLLNKIFDRIIIVTNQKGVGKGIMSQEDLDHIHNKMRVDLNNKGGNLTAIYAATEASFSSKSQHKPNLGMGLQAKTAFPEIDFKKAIMVGDSISDIEFGRQLGMWTVLIEGKEEEQIASAKIKVNQRAISLYDWTLSLIKKT
jgi:histidinol-phosphate phosphatase family domain/HAD-superfamily hydrolase, subfamily IIIA